MSIEYPLDCDLARRKTEYLYKAQEELRFLHNNFSKWLHKGLSVAEYETLPIKLQDKYRYVKQLSQEGWDRFHAEDFTTRSDRLCQEMCIQRAELKKSTTWSIDIGEI